MLKFGTKPTNSDLHTTDCIDYIPEYTFQVFQKPLKDASKHVTNNCEIVFRVVYGRGREMDGGTVAIPGLLEAVQR